TWEMDGVSGDEYSAAAPLYVVDNPLVSSVRALVVGLTLEGVFDRMARHGAESSYYPDDTDTQTVKALIDAIADTTLDESRPYGNYSAVTTVWDSEDSLVDTFMPKDLFSINLNATRADRIKFLLAFTGMKMRVEADGKLHFFDPTISGASFDYEYALLVSGEHTFLDKEVRNRFVDPNKVIVKTRESHLTPYSGSATSATSFALEPAIKTIEGRFASDAQCAAIAAAIIEAGELDAQRGAGKFTMNCGQEAWDWVKITDRRQSDSVTGNVRAIRRRCRIGGQSPPVYEMSFSFGKEARGPSASALLAQIPQEVSLGVQIDPTAFVTWAFWEELRLALDDAFISLNLDIFGMRTQILALHARLQGAEDTLIEWRNNVTFRTVAVTDDLTIPSKES
ncbi:hypothetical protein LCGC14_2570320, partial [marine sediment metagenome]